MAKVEVRCFAHLREFLPEEAEGGVYYYNTDKITILEIADELNLPKEELHLIMKNGVKVNLQAKIEEGDRIGFFPPIGGG